MGLTQINVPKGHLRMSGLAMPTKIAVTVAYLVAAAVLVSVSLSSGEELAGFTLPFVVLPVGTLALIWFYRLDRSTPVFIMLAFIASVGQGVLDAEHLHGRAVLVALGLGFLTFIQPLAGQVINKYFERVDSAYNAKHSDSKRPVGKVLLAIEIILAVLVVPH